MQPLQLIPGKQYSLNVSHQSNNITENYIIDFSGKHHNPENLYFISFIREPVSPSKSWCSVRSNSYDRFDTHARWLSAAFLSREGYLIIRLHPSLDYGFIEVNQ